MNRLVSPVLRGTLATALLVAGALGVAGAAEAPTGPADTTVERSATTNASQRYGWRPALWDFAWESGESLTSRPSRGTLRQGRWIDASTGSGRASHYNGGLMLDSQFGNRGGDGDFGTTSVTLRDNAQKYGRWEFRLRMWALESADQDFRVRFQLIPEDPAEYFCGARTITVADVAPHSNHVRVGVNSRKADAAWTYTKPSVNLGEEAHNFAIEVARGHISWFLDGDTIATVKSRAAVSGVPLTARLVMQGDGQQEMNRTKVISDWQRSWTIESGRHPTNGHALSKGALEGGC